MAKNEIYRDGDSLTVPVDSSVESGNLVAFASGLAGVAETSAKQRENGDWYATVRFEGVFAVYNNNIGFGLGDAAYVNAPSAGPAQGVNLDTEGTKVGTVVGFVDNTALVLLHLNK